MSWFDRWLRRQPRPEPAPPEPLASPDAPRPAPTATRARDTWDDTLGRLISQTVLTAPADFESTWRARNLDAETLSRVSPPELMRLLAELSPDVSRALWDFVRLCNPSHEVRVTRSRDSRSPYLRGQAALDAFLDRLATIHGTIDVFYGKLFVTAFLRGAVFMELVLAGGEPVDIALPDPFSARFRRVRDRTRGDYWQLGQWQGNRFVPLDGIPTVVYAPVDPFPNPDPPYGRPLASPALFTTLFLLGLLHDLRRVIAQQGYPRLDIEVKLQALREAATPDVLQSQERYRAWVAETIEEVKRVYSQLEPDDAYIHTDVVQINRPQGTLSRASMSEVGEIIALLERMACRALKTMPIMMGLSQSISEANANRQWEIQAAGIRSLQRLVAEALRRLYTLALRAQGIPAYVAFAFGELRAAEALRDEQVRMLRLRNALDAYFAGYITHDEAANQVVGHDPVLAQPLFAVPTTPSNVLGGLPNLAKTSPESETGREAPRNGHRNLTGDTLHRVV
jgi:hypothetical protein